MARIMVKKKLYARNSSVKTKFVQTDINSVDVEYK